MDQIKIGKFIAELRRKENLTQEQLGERIGVTNKTISRWENGNYMPDIEMLMVLSKEFHVSVNELLAGEILDEAEFRKIADENVLQIAKANQFSIGEKKKYFINKWRKEHIALFVLLAIILASSIILPMLFHRPIFIAISPFVALAEYAYQNNAMMSYVEKSIYKN